MSAGGATDYKLPSSMEGSPICSLVPPGECQFGEEPVSVPLLEKFPVSKTSTVLRFGLPDSSKPLNLSTCACLLAVAEIDGETVIRPYTPISTNESKGSFDLLIKNYGPTAKMSHFMCDVIKPGETSVSFKHIKFNVKTQAPFPFDHIVMLVGGTGITPMVQALHAILGAKGESTPKVTMLYGSRSSDDILGYDLLHKWAEEHSDKFTLVDILSHEPDDSSWKGARGYVNKEMIEKYSPKPDASEKFQFFVCGPPVMYDALCGPRTETDVVKGLLGEMGYQPEQVYKF